MILNPEETIRFLQRLDVCFEKRHVPRIDLSKVRTITVDAIVLLRSRLPSGRRFRGNFPEDPAADKFFRESGFMEHVKTGQIRLGEPNGSVVRESELLARPALADGLISWLTDRLFGEERRSPGSYTTMIECMNNTRHWAHERTSVHREKWWLMVYSDKANGKGIFAFADNGVGILKSANITAFRRGLTDVVRRAKPSIVRDILDGEVPSASNQDNRGLGLPGMKGDCAAGLIRGLKIITNNVFADLDAESYLALSASFKGTLIYWELGETL